MSSRPNNSGLMLAPGAPAPIEVPDYPISPRESPGQGMRVGTIMATPVGQCVEHGLTAEKAAEVVRRFVEGDRSVAWFAGHPLICGRDAYDPLDPTTDALVRMLRSGDMPWRQAEINALLARLDRGETTLVGGKSKRTQRRRAAERAEVSGALARDGRRHVGTILDEVHARRSTTGLRNMTCAWCGAAFEAKRADALYCPTHRKPTSRTAQT